MQAKIRPGRFASLREALSKQSYNSEDPDPLQVNSAAKAEAQNFSP
jgi:hypothetical protein